MKKILGLDLGTNSIGWALVDIEMKKIEGMGSRIIPMGTDKQDYEKGIGITKNADRRNKRTTRKMNKRYKIRRNKLLFVLHELGMLPTQFQFKNNIPEANKIQDLELLPIMRGALQLTSLAHYNLRANAIKDSVDLKDFGKILYGFNQLRGYSGGNNIEETKHNKDNDSDDDYENIKKYEVITQKVIIKSVIKSENTFKIKRGINKGQELNKHEVLILIDDEELEGETELQNLKEKEGQEEELELRIRRNKKGEIISVIFAQPQKTNWRKQMEKTEEDLKKNNLHISQLILQDMEQNKWAKIRNRVFLRQRYLAEFDAIWKTQSKTHTILNYCPKENLEKIANYLFPGKSETQVNLRKAAKDGGLKYIIKDQIIYYQRPLKPQTELISNCQFEKEEKVLPNSHPLFQEFRCWDQINRMYITSKREIYHEKKKKSIFMYEDRFLSNIEKQEIYIRLLSQKQLGFSEVAKIVNLKNDKSEYLNGLNVKAKLKGCDTLIATKKLLGEHFDLLISLDKDIVLKLWQAIYHNANNGSEYDPNSPKVYSITKALEQLNNDIISNELALKLAQNIKFPRKYTSLSEKAIKNILPLMQLNPLDIPEIVKHKFNLIKTGEIFDDFQIEKLEDYIISFIENNPDALKKGGLMFPFASSLVYGKHTTETIKPQIKDYHDIKYEKRNLRNPIVEQLTNETMQIIKALWKQYKFNPEELEIRVELARDLKNSAAERDKIYKVQKRNEKINEIVKKNLEEAKMPITDENILKYKLYEQQKFISPYSGEPMKISLFDSYEIDHIIPKSRYFDDSYSNKVLVEGNLNAEKSNRTAWEYISLQNSKYKIQTIESYLIHINNNFFGKKKMNLLLEKIPTNLIERQLKNTQYITIAVKNELAKVVGSDNVKTSTGAVTDFLRSRWGLKKLFMTLTESRFKQMEYWDWNNETNQPNISWIRKDYDKEKEKQIYEIKNWSKRYDHRHHAIDALVVSLTGQGHIQRLNNLNKFLQDELTNRRDEFKIEVKEDETILEAFFNLEEERRREIQEKIESSRYFEKPFEDLVKQARNLLETMVVSIKPKDKLSIKVSENGIHQLKIRGALHQETYYGKLNGKDTKTIELSKLTAKDISKIIDQKVLAKEIEAHRKKYNSMKEAFTGEGLNAFNERRYREVELVALKQKDISNINDKIIKSEVQNHIEKYKSIKYAFNKNGIELFNKEKIEKIDKVLLSYLNPIPVYKIKVWYSAKEDEGSTLQRLYHKNDKLSVVTGDNYLFIVMEKAGIRVFDIASLYDSADIAKRALLEKDKNYKQRICEDFRIKHKNKPDSVLFTLQQNDLVYIPENSIDPILKLNNNELKEWLDNSDNKKKFSNRVYKVAKFTGKDCYFVPHNYANTISVAKDLTEEEKMKLKVAYGDKKIPKNELNFVEYGSYRDCSPYISDEVFVKSLVNKKEKTKPIKIQDSCIKLQVDWLGNITKVIS